MQSLLRKWIYAGYPICVHAEIGNKTVVLLQFYIRIHWPKGRAQFQLQINKIVTKSEIEHKVEVLQIPRAYIDFHSKKGFIASIWNMKIMTQTYHPFKLLFERSEMLK